LDFNALLPFKYRGIVLRRHTASLLPLIHPSEKTTFIARSDELAMLYLPEIDQCSIVLLSFSYS
jgi:hypothetical protein